MSLFDQNTFYAALENDLQRCQRELIIESPFITASRINVLLPIFGKMCRCNVKIIINTRDPIEHEGDYVRQAQEAVMILQDMGITVLYTAKHHRKLAIIDRHVTYEGSLNILSFSDSCEIMRRIVSDVVANDLYKYLRLHRYNKEINYDRF
jgi:phosphatidylserine/phosphatidylglycerophosphate/cardiolipin synthase-like enzyme